MSKNLKIFDVIFDDKDAVSSLILKSPWENIEFMSIGPPINEYTKQEEIQILQKNLMTLNASKLIN